MMSNCFMYIVLINSEINDYWWLTLVVFKRKLQSMPKNMILVTGRNWKRYIPAQSNRLSIKIAVISLEKLELYLPVNVLMITSLESNKSQLSKFQNACIINNRQTFSYKPQYLPVSREDSTDWGFEESSGAVSPLLDAEGVWGLNQRIQNCQQLALFFIINSIVTYFACLPLLKCISHYSIDLSFYFFDDA